MLRAMGRRMGSTAVNIIAPITPPKTELHTAAPVALAPCPFFDSGNPSSIVATDALLPGIPMSDEVMPLAVFATACMLIMRAMAVGAGKVIAKGRHIAMRAGLPMPGRIATTVDNTIPNTITNMGIGCSTMSKPCKDASHMFAILLECLHRGWLPLPAFRYVRNYFLRYSGRT
jgi:hypothetical protein